MSYAPFQSNRPFEPDRHALKLIGRDFDAVLKDPASLAQASLYKSLDGRLDDAIQQLRSLAEQSSGESWLWSDLAVLYIERARHSPQSHDLIEALAASSRAQAGPNTSLESQFNHALILEKHSLLYQAVSAWEAYLRRDPDSAWSAEARLHLGTLLKGDAAREWEKSKKIFSAAAVSTHDLSLSFERFPQAVREYTEEEVLGAWARASLSGDAQAAAKHLAVARQVGVLLASRGEHLLSDSVSRIDRLANVDKQGSLDLARHYQTYLEGLSAYKSGLYDDASTLFSRAREGLQRTGASLYLWAELRKAICDLQRFRYAEAGATLNKLLHLAPSERYPVLRGMIFWTLGLVEGNQANPAGALNAYKHALDLFNSLGEHKAYALVERLMAESFRLLGNQVYAWNHLRNALQRVHHFVNAGDRYSIYSEAAALAKDLGLPHATVMFIDESLAGIARKDILRLAVGLRRKASLCAEAGLIQEGLDALGEARALLPSLSKGNAQATIEADLLAVEGELLLPERPEQSIKSLTLASDYYGGPDYRIQMARLLSLRARAFESVGRLDLAEKDLERSIEIIETEWKQTPKDHLETFLDQRREIYDAMAGIQIALHQGERALAYVEQVRSRSLWEAAASSPSAILIDELTKSLPGDSVIVEYALLGQSAFAWVLSRNSFDLVQLEIRVPEIEAAVYHIREAAVQKNEREFRVQLQILFDMIIRPLLPKVQRGGSLVIVPDNVLHAVPFAALLDSVSRRFLVQDFVITVAPSANFYLANSSKTVSGKIPESILLVGAPEIDRIAWPSLSSLPKSREEISEIASLYPTSEVLVGSSATPRAVLGAAGRREVLHIATHAQANFLYPSLSFLVLSKSKSAERNDTGALYMRDLSGIRLPQARVVVLSACRSLDGPIGRTEGIFGLARPFFKAGVPSVIGTLWRISDDDAPAITLGLHIELRNGRSPVESLRAAQLDSIERRVSPISWSAFQAFGS